MACLTQTTGLYTVDPLQFPEALRLYHELLAAFPERGALSMPLARLILNNPECPTEVREAALRHVVTGEPLPRTNNQTITDQK